MRRFAFLVVAIFTATPAAYAQEDVSALVDRLDRLERDVNFVQKQVYRSGASGSDGNASSAPLPANAGQMQMRIVQLEEEMRRLHGALEQAQFQNKQTATEMKKLSDDIDYRLRAIEQKQAEAAAMPAPAAAVAEPAAAETPAKEEPAKPATYEGKEKEKEVKETKEKPALTGKDFPDSNAHYAHAYKLLSEKKFADSASSFDAFVKKYPSDPLTSNAYYWLGESQYARNDFTRATESFRKGFEANPDGSKAPDNLYKLAMSLSQIKRKSEACIVLGQVVNKYGESAARTAAKAETARTTLQCK